MLKSEMNEKWRQWKSDIKSIAYHPCKTEEEVASKLPDDRVEPSQYRDLVHHWYSESTQETPKVNSFLCTMSLTFNVNLFIFIIFYCVICRKQVKLTEGIVPSLKTFIVWAQKVYPN